MPYSRRSFQQKFLQSLAGFSTPLFLLDRCENYQAPLWPPLEKVLPAPEIELLIPTFLGNDQRRFYGRGQPSKLQLVDRFYLGTGLSDFQGLTEWSGAGWTGQPTLVGDRGKSYLVIGSFDHHLRKIDLATNKEVWRYKFDDLVKGTATIYVDRSASPDNQIVILQGSRQGINNSLGQAEPIPSLRAISFRTGKALWQLDITLTDSYSRDHDGSPLDLGNGLVFTGGENGIGYFLHSATGRAKPKNGIMQPEITQTVQLYKSSDIDRQGGNLVTESSASRLGNRIYISAGSGHVFGIDVDNRKIVWDFFTGADMDGSVTISQDGKLFVPIERQYISGQGGIIKLNPEKPANRSVEWFLPTSNLNFEGWEGGLLGSVALNDEYNSWGQFPALFATIALDGYLYIGCQSVLSGQTVLDPHQKTFYPSPLVIYKKELGHSISTPIFTDDHHLIVPSYNGVHWLKVNFDSAPSRLKGAVPNSRGEWFTVKITYRSVFMAGNSFEATPIIWDNLIRIASRDGYLYTIG